MAVKITSVRDAVERNGLKVLVHGPAGAGKTVLCATTGSPTLFISAESGLLSIKEAPDYIHTAKVEKLSDLQEILTGLEEGTIKYVDKDGNEQPYSWVALDSITEIAERVLAYEKDRNKDPRQAYQQLQESMMVLLKAYRDLEGYNVVMSCKQHVQVDQFSSVSFYAPMMPGTKLGPQIPYLFDEVFALRVEKDEEGEDYRVLQTNRDLRFEAKDRSGALDMFEKPNLKHILNKIENEE